MLITLILPIVLLRRMTDMNPNLLPWKQDDKDDFEPDKDEMLKIHNIHNILGIVLLVIALVMWCVSCCNKLHII